MTDALTPAETVGWRIMESLPDDVREQLFAYIDTADVPRD